MKIHLITLAALGLMNAGCSKTASDPTSVTPAVVPPVASSAKVLDGDFSDWATDEDAYADDRWIWIKFSPETRPTQAIQAAPYSTRLRIDTDLDPKTGRSIEIPRMGDEASQEQPQGLDVLIAFSPINELNSIGVGTGVTRYDADGNPENIGHASLGVACLPTFASEDYELRIDRLGDQGDAFPESGTIEIIVDQVDAQGKAMWSDRFTLVLPTRASAPAQHDIAMPTKPTDGVRIMSANVLFSAPLTEPDAFARVIDATSPDVILYQEWFKTERPKVEAWIDQHIGEDWTLHFPDERSGVAIATRHPILKHYDQALPPSGVGRPARATAALIDTDAGELLAISVHLKCCGSAGSEADLTRIDQAKAINAFADSVHANHPEAMVVIGGDYNLVGSRVPLDVLARGLGVNGDDLDPAYTPVLGDATVVTWVDERSSFGPGRLDWLLYDDSRSKLVNGFMLDTRVLTNEALNQMGLERTDTMKSDHLPMVLDLTRVD